MTEQELSYWLAFDLLKSSGIGVIRLMKLHSHFGSMQAIWEADRVDLLQVSGIGEHIVDSFIKARSEISLERGLMLMYKHNVKAIPITSLEYPERLRSLKNPPAVLYIKGIWDESWYDQAIAMVGTREASDYGMALASQISADLSQVGITVITGIARGIDVAAHQGAVGVEGHRSVAVVANGVDQIVPQSNKLIYEVLAREGAIISEYPPETKPERGFFPARNRIIAALSKAVVVVEAAERSGAFITAEFAEELGLPVYCCAGHVHNPVNKGCHHWIKDKRATLLTDAGDLIQDLKLRAEEQTERSEQIELPRIETEQDISQAQTHKQVPKLNEDEQKIYQIIKSDGEIIFDQLAEESSMPVNKINSILMKLTLKKLIVKKGLTISVS